MIIPRRYFLKSYQDGKIVYEGIPYKIDDKGNLYDDVYGDEGKLYNSIISNNDDKHKKYRRNNRQDCVKIRRRRRIIRRHKIKRKY